MDSTSHATKRPSPRAIWKIVKDGLGTPRPIGRRTVAEITDVRTAWADEIRRTLTHATSARIGDLIAQATEHYAEQDRRAERTERRATTLQGAVSVAAAVTSTQHTWHRPNNPQSIVFRAGLERAHDFDIETLAAVLASAHRNGEIAPTTF